MNTLGKFQKRYYYTRNLSDNLNHLLAFFVMLTVRLNRRIIQLSLVQKSEKTLHLFRDKNDRNLFDMIIVKNVNWQKETLDSRSFFFVVEKWHSFFIILFIHEWVKSFGNRKNS